MVELLYQHACYIKISYRFSCTTGIAIHTTWNSDHLTAAHGTVLQTRIILLQQLQLHIAS